VLQPERNVYLGRSQHKTGDAAPRGCQGESDVRCRKAGVAEQVRPGERNCNALVFAAGTEALDDRSRRVCLTRGGPRVTCQEQSSQRVWACSVRAWALLIRELAMIRERDAPAGVGCVAVVYPSIGKLYTHSTS
jgi:hypothetical protein